MKATGVLEKYPIKHMAGIIYRLALSSFLFLSLISPLLISAPVQALSITTNPSPLPEGQVGVAYGATLTAHDGTEPYTWTGPTGQFPPGLSFADSGSSATISGTPTAAGTYAFSITVEDDASITTTLSTTIIINAPPFTIITSDLPQGKEGTSYSGYLSVSGGTSPYNWTISSGNLPSGLILQSTGYIQGTPVQGTVGTHSFTVSVTDSSSPQRTTQKSFSIYIEKGAYQVTVSIDTGLEAGEAQVSVDGRIAATLIGGESKELSFDLGTTKRISVEPIIEDPSKAGVRYRVETESKTVSELQRFADFSYFTEYLVTVNTEPALNTQPRGAGWYKKNSSATVSANPEVNGNTGTQFRFAYWLLPGDNKITSENANFTVDGPVTIIARYDTYYRLTIESLYGVVEGGGWYKAGSQARWLIVDDKVPMPGLIGLFQGKFKAVNSSGTVTMEEPKTVTVFWEPDYTLPYILIPVTILAIALVIVGIYMFLRRQRPPMQPQPAMPLQPYLPYMPPPRPIPIPQPHTTVVMIGDKVNRAKQLPQSTKEQLLEKFSELLEQYESEIKTSLGAKELPKIQTVQNENMISAPQFTPPAIDAEFTQEMEDKLCLHTAKKFIRNVVTEWKDIESKTITSPASGDDATPIKTEVSVVWSRNIYQEWELFTCTLQANHTGNHQGNMKIVYSLLNTITENKSYGPTDKLEPPSPHFTDGISEVTISSDQIIPTDELPTETIK